MKNYNRKKLTSTTIDNKKVEHTLSEELVVSKRTKKKLPPFRCIGDGRYGEIVMIENGKSVKKRIKTFDMIYEMSLMTADEKLCFMTIYDQINDDYEFVDTITNIGIKVVCKYNYQQKIKFESKTKQKHFLNGFKLLKEKDIVKRIKRGVYMISPYAIIDTNGFQQQNEELWNSLK